MQCLLLPLIPTENLAEPRLSALTSTSPPVVAAATATTHNCAAAVIPVAMLPRPSNSSHPLAPVPSNPRHPVSATKSKVAQLRRHVTPQVSSPIDIYRLELELANHPDKTFVFNLLSMLREGAHIDYSGPRTHRVSPNLISAAQHPDVVTWNLHKEVTLGRVAGPYFKNAVPCAWWSFNHLLAPSSSLVRWWSRAGPSFSALST